jgi:tetraacyldisaccharide 4'-kinase
MLRHTLETFLNRQWYGEHTHTHLNNSQIPSRKTQGVWLFCMRPLEWLYTRLARQHWNKPKYQALRQQALPVPVVVVGNIVAGGSGKTPITQALAQALTHKGLRVGIVSRGYGGTVRHALRVDAAFPQQYGDEPCLLARTTGCPVAVAAKRRDAVLLLCADTSLNLDIILSDDGLQHAGLHRDFELCVIGTRGLGNGRGLPAGALREPITRLESVDAVVCWQAGDYSPANTAFNPNSQTRILFSHVPHYWVQGRHSALQCLDGSAVPETDNSLSALASVQKIHNTPIVAAAGLAQPQPFYDALAAAGLSFTTLPVPDHGCLSAAQLATITPNAWLLVTEKDAVKLRQLAANAANLANVVDTALPDSLAARILVVPWRVQLPAELVDNIAALVR